MRRHGLFGTDATDARRIRGDPAALDAVSILPGHEWAAVERVVERYDHYEVVEKFGEARRVAAEEWREGDADIANPS